MFHFILFNYIFIYIYIYRSFDESGKMHDRMNPLIIMEFHSLFKFPAEETVTKTFPCWFFFGGGLVYEKKKKKKKKEKKKKGQK